MTAITTTQVTGRIALANDTSLANGQIEFVLTNFETDAGSDVTIVQDVVTASIDASGDIDISLWPNADGGRDTRYKVTAIVPNVSGAKRFYLGEIIVPESGPVDLNDLLDAEVSPATFPTSAILEVPEGAVGIDRVALINATFTLAIATDAKVIVRGDQYITGANGSVAPNGVYRCEWVNAKLIWSGDDITDLTQVLENPTGTTEPEGSGKYVLFDTKNCGASTNSGSLTIRGSSPGDMTLANRGNIPANLVAITASEGGSGDMVWDGLTAFGCGYGLFQGDQRGTGANILPYTRWTVDYFKAQFCLVAMEGGFSGNCFDDGSWSNVRLTRNADNGTIRTDFVANSILLNGLTFAADKETWTATTTAGSATVDTSAAHGRSIGDIVAIEGANDNLSGTATTALVSRVSAVPTATSLTLETAADNTVSGASVIVDPPSFNLFSADLIAQHIYVEQVLDVPVLVGDRGRIACLDWKVSDGVMGSRYNVSILLTGMSVSSVDIALNNRSEKFLSTAKYIVGVPMLVNGADLNTCTVNVRTRDAEADFTEAQVIGGVSLETDHLGANTLATGLPQSDERNITVRYTGGLQGYQVSMPGLAFKTFKQDLKNVYSLGSNLKANATVQGMTASGNFGSGTIGTGSVSKTAPGTGAIAETITMAAGDTIVVDVTASVMTATGFQICLFDGGATAGDIVVSGPSIRSASTVRAYLTVPSGGADRVGIFGFTNAVGTFTNFTAKKIEAS